MYLYDPASCAGGNHLVPGRVTLAGLVAGERSDQALPRPFCLTTLTVVGCDIDFSFVALVCDLQ